MVAFSPDNAVIVASSRAKELSDRCTAVKTGSVSEAILGVSK